MSDGFRFEENLARASTLPASWFFEDAALCEAVQRGLSSRLYDRGRLSVKRENRVHHFHGLLAAAPR